MAAKVKPPQTALEKPQRGPGRPRGVTRARYLVLSRMVKAHETTWADLERQGIVLPSQRESDFRRDVRKQLKGERNL
jgi:hypothetical protein